MTRKQYDEISELALECFRTTRDVAARDDGAIERDADAKQKFWKALSGMVEYGKDAA